MDVQCNDPADALCLTQVGGGTTPLIGLPGGYCTKYCREAEECGSGDPACFSMGTKSSGISVCVATCFAPEDCRHEEGYTCMILLPGLPGFCVPG